MFKVIKRIALNFCYAFFVAWGALFGSIHAEEVITSFHSDIYVLQDATLVVRETIKVISADHQIKRGIFREFPTRYKDRFGTNVVINFSVRKISCDGRSVAHSRESRANGVRIYIGDRDILLAQGAHTFVIEYAVNRQIGFFKECDELYWNVTGNGWIFSIEQCSATVYLPKNVAVSDMQTWAYTGYFGSKASNATIEKSPGLATYVCQSILKPTQGLTISLAWPKGVVNEPALLSRIVDLIRENPIILTLIFVLWAIIFAVGVWYFCRFLDKNASPVIPVIPLFYPPKNRLPSAVNYIVLRKYSHIALASEIVNMACYGLLTIEHKKHIFSSSYTLHKAKNAELLNAWHVHRMLYDILFEKDRTAVNTSKDKAVMRLANESLSDQLNSTLTKKFLHNKIYIQMQTLKKTLSWILFAPLCIFLHFGFCKNTWIYPLIISIAVFIYVLSKLWDDYTAEGKVLKAEIDGFKLYLSVAEVDRMAIVGTPPEKTPELYEKYLPYAIALGVEEAWTKQFASVFKLDEQRSHYYTGYWYRDFQANSFSSSISSSITAPGSVSGGGGRGSSGRGGGGGGGGGW